MHKVRQKELAKHWGVSLQEVKRIANIMNENFYCGIAQRKTDHLFYGVMFRWHESPSGNKTPFLTLSSKQGYQTKAEAIRNWNDLLDKAELSKLCCEIMDVPKDAFKALKKIPEPVALREYHIVSIWRDKEHTKA